MENKINIAELLKDCPKGMELDCTMYENLYFDYVREHAIYPIVCYTVNNKGEKISIVFNWYGKHTPGYTAKCVIFPKGKTTWEGFIPPCQFKDGDVLISAHGKPFILKKIHNNKICESYCGIRQNGEFVIESLNWTSNYNLRLATEEEKKKLFDAIKDNGYTWNKETKTLDKLPKFKDGDIITCSNGACTFTSIFKDKPTDTSFQQYCSVILDNNKFIGGIMYYVDYANPRFATEEEKEKLFDAIKDNGYTWNKETKTLEKLVESNPYSGVSFKYNGHTWGMCARDNGVEILVDGEIKERVFLDNKLQGKSAFEVWKDMRLEVYQQASGNRNEPNCSDDTTKMFSLNDIDEIFEKIAESCESESYLWTINDAKDGDILAFDDNTIVIFKDLYNKTTFHSYCHIEDGVFSVSKLDCPDWWGGEFKPATKEQRDFLFQKIKEAGYKWNFETKTLDKLIEPKFKVGDKIRHKNDNTIRTINYIYHDSYGLHDCHRILFEDQDEYELVPDATPKFKVGDRIKYRSGEIVYRIVQITEDSYVLDNLCSIPISIEHMYNLVPNKFDINTLKPFDKVLVRGNVGQRWTIDFFGFMDNNKGYPFVCVGHYVTQCIPYESNEHLLGTTNDCDEFYKNWE